MARRATDSTAVDLGRADNAGDNAGDNADRAEPDSAAEAAAPAAAPADAPAPAEARARPAKVKAGKKKRRAKRTRPGEIDPEAAPRVGSSPYPGLPYPLGATPYENGTNFAVVADGVPGVSDVQLCLIDRDGNERRVTMDEKTYGIWHTFVPDVRPGQRYGFRVPERDPSKILLDPYARQVTTTDYDLIAAASHGVETLGRVPLGIVTEPQRSTSVRPWVPWEQTVIYEAHVTGLTRLHPDVPPELRGKFLGVAHPAVIEHLKSLSVTTLELLPVHASAVEPQLHAGGRKNYWGYSTLNYFAPDPDSPPCLGWRSASSSRWSTRCTQRASRWSLTWSTTTPARVVTG